MENVMGGIIFVEDRPFYLVMNLRLGGVNVKFNGFIAPSGIIYVLSMAYKIARQCNVRGYMWIF